MDHEGATSDMLSSALGAIVSFCALMQRGRMANGIGWRVWGPQLVLDHFSELSHIESMPGQSPYKGLLCSVSQISKECRQSIIRLNN
jgi:hypothetical protein